MKSQIENGKRSLVLFLQPGKVIRGNYPKYKPEPHCKNFLELLKQALIRQNIKLNLIKTKFNIKIENPKSPQI